MSIHLRWDTMSCPARVSDAHVALGLRLEVEIGSCKREFADFIKGALEECAFVFANLFFSATRGAIVPTVNTVRRI